MAVVVILIVGVIVSLLLNLLVLVVLLKKGQKINYMELIMVSLSISDLLQAAIGYSVEIHSFLSATKISDVGCQISAFSTTFLGLVSIFHLVGIAIQRYFIIKYPMKVRLWAHRPSVSLYVVLPGWLYGFVWAVPPLAGWNSYTRANGVRHLCGIDLNNRDPFYVSYTYNLLVWCFCIPVLVICFCCYSIYGALKTARQRQSFCLIQCDEARGQCERIQNIMSLVLIGTFLFAWSPYAVCVFVLTARGSLPTPLLSFAAIFAKLSTMYNPIIYYIFMGDFRTRCKKLFRKDKNVTLLQFTAEMRETYL